MAKDKWPSREELDKVLEILEKTEGSLHLNDDATPLERFRWELCQKLLIYMRIHNIKQKDLAKELDIDEPEMSRILHHRIEKVSTDKLLKMVQHLHPNLKLSIG